MLAQRLREAVPKLNPGLAPAEVEAAVAQLAAYGAQSLVDGNREIYDWLRNGVPVERVESAGHRTVLRVRMIDFEGENDLLAVQQFTVRGQKVRRPDIVLFVNGLPLVVIELKNPADLNADIESAWNQIQTYKADIPQLFYFNLLNVISDGTVARYGALTADLSRHSRWRLRGGNKVAKGQLELDVLIRGLLEPRTLLDFFHGFVAYGGNDGGASFKIIAQWHQYHGVKKAVARAVEALLQRKDGKGGVIWFTQGSGKSLLALFYVMALRDRPEFQNPTVVLVTDRNDLDGQLFETFADCRWSIRATPVQADSREDLRDKLTQSQAGGVIFTTMNKFAPRVGETTVPALCDRSNVIVIADEAHRTQYGFKADIDTTTGQTKYGLAKYMRDALPNAIYLGMTGTPISLDDRDTEAVFGTYVDVYDMIAAQEDEAVVPVSYESRIIELRFNEAEKQALMDEFLVATEDEDEDEQTRTVSRLTRLEKEAALRQLVAKGVLVEGVNDVFATLGLGRPDISLLDEEFLKQIREMPTKNLAAELLAQLIADQVRARGQRNAMQGKEFTEKLEEAIAKYQNRALTTVEVIEELIKLAKEINAARPPHGMSEEEFAFYQALIDNESAVREMADETLRALAQELTDKLRRSATINWQNRASSRARMVAMVKVLLVKYKYPPDKQPRATEMLITQAELLADTWAHEDA